MRKDELRLVLDQYNRQIGYFRDTAQKIIAAITAYAGLHAGSTAVALTEKTHRELFLIAHFTVAAFAPSVGNANLLRLVGSHRALVARLEPEGATLRELGVLRHEPPLVALAWGTLYAVVHGGFLIAVYLVKWH
ncbi:MAG TPA: hypothetical protein VK634_04385 [Reyranella sp.]|nr:hypothetical protein [Reyranella sp.]